MKRALIHVGLSKTGTTTIQQTLAAHRTALRNRGASYPLMSDKHKAQHHLVGLFHKRGPRHFWFQNQGMDEAAALHAANAMRQAVEKDAAEGDHVLLLSSEYFQRLRAPQLTEMDAWLAGIGYRLETLCVIREPVALTASRIGQAVKTGSNRIADLFAAPYRNEAQMHLRAALRVLGRDRVHVRKMEDARVSGLTRMVLEIAGVTCPEGLVDQRENTGFSRDAIYLLDAISGIEGARDRLGLLKKRRIRNMKGPRFTLPPDVAQRIIAESRAEQDWLNQRFGLSYDAPDLPDGPPVAELVAQAEARLPDFIPSTRAAAGWRRRRPARSR